MTARRCRLSGIGLAGVCCGLLRVARSVAALARLRLTILFRVRRAASMCRRICGRCVSRVMRRRLRLKVMRGLRCCGSVVCGRGIVILGRCVLLLESGNRALDEIIARTRKQLSVFRAAGGCDEEFVARLIEQFRAAAESQPPGAGSAHMALSVYRMSLLSERVECLEGDLAMREDALKFMFALDQM